MRLAEEERERLRPLGLSVGIAAALVRSTTRARPAGDLVDCVTSDPDVFFSRPLDVVVEVLGGIDASSALVRRALDCGIPVVTANKSLIAAHGHSLDELACRQRTALRYEASCIAGVPFLGTFERRPLASRVRGLTAVLNGTSNAIVGGLEQGATFEGALHDAQRRGLAEPDPSADVIRSGRRGKARAAASSVRARARGGRRHRTRGIDIDRCRRPEGRARARWNAETACARDLVDRVIWKRSSGRRFSPGAIRWRAITGATNGIVLDGVGGRQCFVGPGAGPDVTAATLLDDVFEVVRERRGRPSAPRAVRIATPRRPTGMSWLVRIAGGSASPGHDGAARHVRRLVRARVEARWPRLHADVPCGAWRVSTPRVVALEAATGCDATAIPALDEEGFAW